MSKKERQRFNAEQKRVEEEAKALKERILKRSQLESRKDDSVFDKRFEIYQETYKEILNFVDLNFDLKNIEANKPLESINTEIKGFLKGL